MEYPTTKFFREENRGRISCPNGWEISFCWGGGMHGSNYHLPAGIPIKFSADFEFEVLCFDPKGQHVYSLGDAYSHVSWKWISQVLLRHVCKLQEGDTTLPEQPWDE